MNYYDNTVMFYDNKIDSYHKQIVNANLKIKQLEDDIYELRCFKEKISKVDNAVEEASSSTSKRIFGFPSAAKTPFSLLKVNFFSSIFDALKGTEYLKAKNEIEGSYTKIETKINELQNEIQQLRNEIGNCNSNIKSLTYQKTNYIKQITASKQ